ncbi:calcium-binding EGF-like domain-containing protein [Psychroserpens ponticola]|uniref:Calcium-binding EGF-like domain-containing protein n=1 Tax=Psychroserpens ponticola TaxID=2932268 RepID=A0ABY7RX95_9FLAO|nr:calcium-binding EGF-like domain-containing protein [Psychroserpens ponticola]WCO01325.1 calcium-binding EGF-like domain-containing protein [Psychroserpens ponticola]
MRNQIIKLIFLSILTTTYFGCSSDSNSDDCETITCLNGGTFVDCECECPLGYTGNNCSTQVRPSKVIITKAIVKVFPNTDNGEFWDLSIPDAEDALPDIYITLQDSNLITIYDSPTFYENVISGEGTFFEFTLTPPVELTVYDNPFLVNIWDYDTTGEDDFMTSFGFFAYTSNNNFPDIITVVSQSDEILVDLEVTYEW